MNSFRDPGFDPRVAAWLEGDPTTAPAQVLETVLAAIPSVSQRRVAIGFPWRYPTMRTSIRLAAGIALALTLAIGSWVVLGGPRGSDVGASAQPSSTPAPNGTLDGTSWVSLITAADMPSGAQSIPLGTWTMSFATSTPGQVTVMLLTPPGGGGVTYPMTYAAGNTMDLGPALGCAQVEGKPTPTGSSAYKFAISGNSLTFTLVSTDSCAARIAQLTAHAWTKVP